MTYESYLRERASLCRLLIETDTHLERARIRNQIARLDEYHEKRVTIDQGTLNEIK